MTESTPEQQRDAAVLELARLRAGLSAGLNPAQSARLVGTTPEELAADARTLATELGVQTARTPSGSGPDVKGGATGGSLNAGEERYRRQHGNAADG
ncbi:hypothetical protein [Streptomyces sp. NPDC002491]